MKVYRSGTLWLAETNGGSAFTYDSLNGYISGVGDLQSFLAHCNGASFARATEKEIPEEVLSAIKGVPGGTASKGLASRTGLDGAASKDLADRGADDGAIPAGDEPEDHEDNTFNLPDGRPIRRTLKRWYRRIARDVLGTLPTIGVPLPHDFPDLTDYADPMAAAMTPLISAYWDESGKRTRERLGLDPDEWRVVDPHLHQAIVDQGHDFTASTLATTTLKVRDAYDRLKEEFVQGLVTEGETIPQLRDRVRAVFTGLSKDHASLIARTEASRAVHSASLMSAQESGVVAGKVWLLSSNACPLCHELEAKSKENPIPLGGEFANIGNNPTYSSIRMPPGHVLCRCSVTFRLTPEHQAIVDANPPAGYAPGPMGPEPQEEAPKPKRERKPKPVVVAEVAPATEHPKPFVPATTIDEAESWLKSHGIEPNWQTKNAIDHDYKIGLKEINEVHAGLHPLFAEYPEAVPAIGRLGSRYALDHNRWVKNYEEHIEDDRKKFESAGRRWRLPEAEKRVRKVMVEEPTPEGDGWEKYSVFEGGAWQGKSKYAAGTIFDEAAKGETFMRFNHRTVVMFDREKSDERRNSDLAKGRHLSGVSEDHFGTAQHEFGHVLDSVHEISDHPKFRAFKDSLTEVEIKNGLSEYATTNDRELLAEGFAEGLRQDSRPLGKRVKSLIDEIVAEKRKK